jgi:hypothetical protein
MGVSACDQAREVSDFERMAFAAEQFRPVPG